MHNTLEEELESLCKRIEENTADLDDYRRYEKLLLDGGLSHAYIFSYLKQAGFESWEDFLDQRNRKQRDKQSFATIVGALIGLGLGLLLAVLFSDDDKD